MLRRITLDIAAGEFVTIMGPSGAGKSTLLAILGMLDHDWTGEYHLLGTRPAMKPQGRIELNKKYVGFVFQQYPPPRRPHRGREPGLPLPTGT